MSFEFGHNNFKDRFEWYEWSAPIYTSPESIIKAICNLIGSGKILTNIRFIGAAKNMTNEYFHEFEKNAYYKLCFSDISSLKLFKRHLLVPDLVSV